MNDSVYSKCFLCLEPISEGRKGENPEEKRVALKMLLEFLKISSDGGGELDCVVFCQKCGKLVKDSRTQKENMSELSDLVGACLEILKILVEQSKGKLETEEQCYMCLEVIPEECLEEVNGLKKTALKMLFRQLNIDTEDLFSCLTSSGGLKGVVFCESCGSQMDEFGMFFALHDHARICFIECLQSISQVVKMSEENLFVFDFSSASLRALRVAISYKCDDHLTSYPRITIFKTNCHPSSTHSNSELSWSTGSTNGQPLPGKMQRMKRMLIS